MRIIFFLLSATLIVAADIEFNHSSSLVAKIVNEESDIDEDFKYTASFRRDNVHLCTAALISNKHALTTASCIKDFLIHQEIPDFKSYSIRAGKPDTAEGEICFSIEEVQASRKFRYHKPKVEYDFGLVTLKNNNIVESKYIGWVFWIPGTTPCLPETVDVAVWRNTNGSTEKNEDSQLTLKRITFKVVGNDWCGFRSDGPIICAKPIDVNQTFFKEDIGTPLTVGNLFRGILASLPLEPEQISIFIDINKSFTEIKRLLNDRSNYFRSTLPRKKARFDAIIPFGKRNVKPKYDNPEESDAQNALED